MLPFGNFLTSLAQAYPNDPTVPGVTCAVLREGVFLVRARLRYRATKFDSKEEARALVLVVRHECALDRAIDSLEAEEKREKVNRG
jgi:hypothetical protein